jgi:hypothetical protein
MIFIKEYRTPTSFAHGLNPVDNGGLYEPILKAFKKAGDLLGWLPLTESVTLMIMISFVSAVNFSRLKASNFWRDHSYEVLTTAQTFLTDLLRIQGDARHYLFSEVFDLKPTSPFPLGQATLSTKQICSF